MRAIAGAVAAVLLLAATIELKASTINAASCNTSDVQAALNQAHAGDTVSIPAGTCVWTNRIDWTAPANVTVKGAGTCTGAAATLSCNDATVIVDNFNRSTSDPAMLGITVPSTGLFRLSGLTFRMTVPSGNCGSVNYCTDNGSLRMGRNGSVGTVRLDHLHFDGVRREAITTGGLTGVIDHSYFNMTAGTADNAVRPMGIDPGNAEWAAATNFGTSTGWMYVEDSYFVNGIANDAFSGSKQVFRFNATSNAGFQQHGTGHSGDNRGARAAEFYGNTINGGPNNTYTAMSLYSGPMMAWGNNIGSLFSHLLVVIISRRNNSTYSQTSPPNGWGYCGTSFNGTGSGWDQNSNASTGYACLDQPGRGVGDLLTGWFPNKSNTQWAAAGCASSTTPCWPRQALEPFYEWSNTGTSTGSWTSIDGTLSQNVDYYIGKGNTNCNPSAASCTAGVGSGPRAQRPTNCTKGVAWWSTDQGPDWNTTNGTTNDGTLDICTATNAWTNAAYTPYTYPHPLTQGPNPAPPSNLRIVDLFFSDHPLLDHIRVNSKPASDRWRTAS